MFFLNAVISSPIPIFILLSRGTVSFRKKVRNSHMSWGGGGGGGFYATFYYSEAAQAIPIF